jgi:lysophospholipase L1-like esterase
MKKIRHTLFQAALHALVFMGLLAGCTQRELPPVTVHLVGDSTMADKPDPEHNPERGWGQLLQGWFTERVTIRNHAVNGRSTRSFLEEGRWNEVLRQIAPGDFVMIQFGHNDQKTYDPSRYTNPYSAYRRNLEKMIREAEEKGAQPILLSSIVRRNFNEEGTLVDTHGPYPFVTRQVASGLGVPFIDLQQLTEDLVTGLGPVRSEALYMVYRPGEVAMYPEGRTDNTHLNAAGATEVSRLVAAALRDMGHPLARYLAPRMGTPRVLLITGGHPYDTTEFYELFRSMQPLRFDSLSHPHALRMLASEYIFSYDALLFYDYQPGLPLTDSARYTNLTLHGLPMLFLHHSICSFQQWDQFKQLIGGKYVMESEGNAPGKVSGYQHDLTIPVRVLDHGHPITRGLEDFEILDEGYSDLELTGEIHPLLGTDHPECSGVLAWTNRFGQSPVVYVMLGHDRHAYSNPSFRLLIYNSLNWLSAEGKVN